MVVKYGERCLVFPSHTNKKLVGDGFIYNGKTMANLLGYVSVWHRMSPRDNNVSVEWCLIVDS